MVRIEAMQRIGRYAERGTIMSFAEKCGKIYREKLKQSGELRGYYLKIGGDFYYIAATGGLAGTGDSRQSGS